MNEDLQLACSRGLFDQQGMSLLTHEQMKKQMLHGCCRVFLHVLDTSYVFQCLFTLKMK